MEFNRNRNLTFTTLETTIGPYLLHEECLDPDIQPNSKNTWYNKVYSVTADSVLGVNSMITLYSYYSPSTPLQGCYKSFQVRVFNALFRVLVGIILAILVFEVSIALCNYKNGFLFPSYLDRHCLVKMFAKQIYLG